MCHLPTRQGQASLGTYGDLLTTVLRGRGTGVSILTGGPLQSYLWLVGLTLAAAQVG